MKIMVINGPNINMIGIREPEIYGKKDYEHLKEIIYKKAHEIGVFIEIKQSNHEGEIVDFIQEAYFNGFNGIIINPGGYTHTSVAIMDAIFSVNLPCVEVHISNTNMREDFRKISFVSKASLATIMGFGLDGYNLAVDGLTNHLKNNAK